MADKKRDRYQTVTLILNDGRKGTFTGPVLVENPRPDVGVCRVLFTEPKELPADCKFVTEGELSNGDS